MSQSGHLELLQSYCRVCGKRGLAMAKNSHIRETGIQLIQNPTFRLLLSRLHDLDIEHESPEIFPKKVGLNKVRSEDLEVQAPLSLKWAEEALNLSIGDVLIDSGTSKV